MHKHYINDFIFYKKYTYNRINKYLLKIFNKLFSINSKLIEAMKYGVLSEGKRIRPLLTYAIGSMFGVNEKNLDAPAAAIECIHAYSLIHDDLPAMDNDLFRRNQLCCHIKFGESTAILAGNALQALAFQLLSTAYLPNIKYKDRIAMITELSKSSGALGMCIGQSIDLYTKNKNIDLKSIEYIYKHKTIAIIKTAIRFGAYAAGKNGRKLIPILDKYAELIGFAFQLKDDISDFVKNNNLKIKKKAILNYNKNTYLNLFGLALSKKKINDLHFKSLILLKKIQSYNYNTTILKAITNFIIENKN